MKLTKSISEIRTQLSEHLENPGIKAEKISMNSAARGIGVSVTAISQFLNAKYTGDNEGLAAKIASWLQRQYERRNYRETFERTLPTTAVTKVLQTARFCHIQGEIGVATGPAGAGKTRGAKLYARQNPDVILIEVLPYSTPKNVISEIHQAVGLSGQGTITTMTADVIDRLKDSERLLVIDEAEHLPYKALETVRRLHDLAGIGIMLVGMPRLITNLRGSQGQYRQLYSRIGIHAVIPDLAENDIQLLVAEALPNSNGVWKAVRRETENARALGKLLKQAQLVAASNGTPVTDEVIREAKQYIIV